MTTANNDFVRADKVVIIHYTLRDRRGEVIDTSVGSEEPLAYLHGAGNIVPGLEKALTGKRAGDRFAVSVSPEEGYGPRTNRDQQTVPRESFPADIDLASGMQFVAEGDNGETMPIYIIRVTDTEVLMDTSHPMAGETLHFEVEVLAMRDATSDERSHGHPHGIDGTEHHHH